MRPDPRFLGTIAAAAVGLLLVCTAAAHAAPASTAVFYDTYLVDAFDSQIIPAPPTTVTTSPRHYRRGRLRVEEIPGPPPGHRVRIWLYSSAPVCASDINLTIRARLTLRTTQFPFTFQDLVVDCTPLLVTFGTNLLAATTPLPLSCLIPAHSFLDTTLGNNLEIVSAALIDGTTNLPMMVPGFRTANACPTLPTAFPEGKLSALGLITRLVQAMDPCLAGVPFAGLPPVCSATNTVTDGTMFTSGSLIIVNGSSSWNLQSSAIGAPLAGKTLRLVVTVRVTDAATTIGQVTHPDLALLCPPVVVPASGNVSAGHNLYTSCGLTPTSAAANVEILQAGIVNSATGEAIAVPGVRRP